MSSSHNTASRVSAGESSEGPLVLPAAGLADGSAFQSQFQHFVQPHASSGSSHASPYAQTQQQPFDMGHMAAALPQSPQHYPMSMPGQYGRLDGPGTGYASFHPRQGTHYQGARGLHFDPVTMARFQQQQQHQHHQQSQHQHQYTGQSQYTQHSPRSPINFQGHLGAFHGPADGYGGYGTGPMQMAGYDPRFPPQGPYGMPSIYAADPQQYLTRPTETAPVPSYPRGPPRKPKQSGHALWVGNLPPAANVTDLKNHFSRDATRDIESLFLISKSNCAFVNYRTEASCHAAMTRFHDSRFHGVRLVCRLRRGTNEDNNNNGNKNNNATSSRTMSAPTGPASATASVTTSQLENAPESVEDQLSPTIVGSQPFSAAGSTADASTPSNPSPVRVPEKYFVVKSLTVQDLEASVRNGVWATQSHNEGTLNRAYDEADTVYLVFSANKSGEYFGYAKMTSSIEGEPVKLAPDGAGGTGGAGVDGAGGAGGDVDGEPVSPGAPQSIFTPATETAPKGRIIDDSARGTIFWEADHSDAEEDGDASEDNGGNGGAGAGAGASSGSSNWGRQFSIEWLSTSRLPFHRTRGLRNPWNSNREVKIARDGTEIEPGVGKRLIGMFHRMPAAPAGSGTAGPAGAGGMGYQ